MVFGGIGCDGGEEKSKTFCRFGLLTSFFGL